MRREKKNIEKAKIRQKQTPATPDLPKSRSRTLSPLRPIIVVTEAGPLELPASEVSAESIGRKAYGLSSLPSEWVPPFFLITASCFDGICSDEMIDSWVTDCLTRTGICINKQVMVRSSGTSETMQDRGQLRSKLCSPSQITSTIRSLIPQLPEVLNGNVHWIVQEYVTPKQQGHLSNERWLRSERRDWVAEFEIQEDRPSFTQSIAVRKWRDGTRPANSDLRCASQFEVTLRLKVVAMWATSLSSRVHFEWVWNGETIRIVQVDLAEPTDGIAPNSILQNQMPSVEITSLHVFHSASKLDYERYGKLRNARLYEEIGYKMPVFYVVDDHESR
jgi:hypothetical protein